MMEFDTNINTVFDIGRLAAGGFTDWSTLGDVKVRPMYNGRLLNLCYTDSAQYKNRWNNFERLSRGLVIALVDDGVYKRGDVVACPFPKFFNWMPDVVDPFEGIEPVEVAEKVDGTLLIVFAYDDKIQVATKAGIDTDQAAMGYKALTAEFDRLKNIYGIGNPYKNLLQYLTHSKMTILFEFTSKENRIVIDYGDIPRIVLLAAYDNATGLEKPKRFVDNLGRDFGFIRPQTYEYDKRYLRENINVFKNSEGFVLKYPSGERMKIKTEEYIALHRAKSIVVSQLSVAKFMASNELDVLIESAQDELYREIIGYERIVNAKVEHVVTSCISFFEQMEEYLNLSGRRYTRKDFAILIGDYEARGSLDKFRSSLLYKLASARTDDKVLLDVLSDERIKLSIINYMIEKGYFNEEAQ